MNEKLAYVRYFYTNKSSDNTRDCLVYPWKKTKTMNQGRNCNLLKSRKERYPRKTNTNSENKRSIWEMKNSRV